MLGSSDAYQVHILKIKFFDHYTYSIVHNPEKHDLSYEGHLIKRLFFFYFPDFLKNTTYVHMTFGPVPTSTHSNPQSCIKFRKITNIKHITLAKESTDSE
jgi:hypothetical protein